MKWNISFLAACIIIGAMLKFALRDAPVVEEEVVKYQELEATALDFEESAIEEQEIGEFVPELAKEGEISDEELARKIAALIKMRKTKSDKDKKGKKKKSLKKAIAEFKKLRELQESYQDIEERALQTEKDPLIAVFGGQSRTVSFPVEQEVARSPAGAISEEAEESIEQQVVEIKSWKDKNNFLYGVESVELYISIRSSGVELPAIISGKVFNSMHERVGDVSYNREGEDLYHATYSPIQKSMREAGKYYVKVSLILGGKVHRLIESFSINTRKVIFYNRIEYEITEEKNLRFKSFCNVIESGIYLFQGALYDRNDKFIAIAETPLRLKSGITWINMDFHGSIFHSKQISGPFTLKSVAIYQVNQDLSSNPQEMIEVGYMTADHNWEEFNSGSMVDGLVHGKVMAIEEALRLEN